MTEWAKRFDQYGLVWESERTIPEVLSDPQVSDNDYIAEVEHPLGNPFQLLRIPFQFSETPVQPRSPAPELGQHTEEILREIGYSSYDISSMKKKKLIS